MSGSDGRAILLATDVRFWRGSLGSEARIASLLTWLTQQRRKVMVLFVGDLHGDDEALLHRRFPDIQPVIASRACEQRIVDRLSPRNLFSSLRWKIHGRYWRARGVSPPPTLDSYYRPECRRLMKALIAEHRPQMVIVEYARLAYLLPERLPPDVCTVIDSHDVQSERWLQFQAQDKTDTLAITADAERVALGRAQHVLAIQPLDAEKFRAFGLPSVHMVMHALSVSATPWRRTGKLLFVGSAMAPNVDAVRQLLNDWPSARAMSGGRIELNLVGSVCSALSEAVLPEGVRLHGRVNDLQPFYDEAELVVNPVRYGSGLKIKSVEALCHGRPLLTTAVGAEGLPSDSAAFSICSGDDFAERIAFLINTPDKLQEMANASLVYAQRHFSADAAFAPLARLLAHESSAFLSGDS